MINHQDRAKEIVYDYVLSQVAGSEMSSAFTKLDQVVVVWFSKTLENWKALIITDLPDDIYYEVTHDGQREITYLDVYVKIENVEVPDDPKPAVLRKGVIRDFSLGPSGSVSPGGEIRTVPVRLGDGVPEDDRPVIGEADVNMITGKATIRLEDPGLMYRDDVMNLPPMSFGFDEAGRQFEVESPNPVRELPEDALLSLAERLEVFNKIPPATVRFPEIIRPNEVRLGLKGEKEEDDARSDGGGVPDQKTLAEDPES